MNLRQANYRAWGIDHQKFPYSSTIADQIHFLVGYAVLAPSVHNSQPWLFKIEDNQLTITPDYAFHLPVADPDQKGLYISLGACVENFITAANAYGLKTAAVFKNESLQITVKGTPLKRPLIETLSAIKSRHSNKTIYDNTEIDKKVIRLLTEATDSNAAAYIFDEKPTLDRISTIHGAAALNVAKDAAFVTELLPWLRTNITRAGDGMPGFISGNSTPKSIIGKVVLKKKPQLFLKAAAVDEILIRSASAVCVVTAKTDNAEGWIAAGRLAERIWLLATSNGLVCHPLTAAINDQSAKNNLKELLHIVEQPVFLMRIGKSEVTHLRTPRRHR